MQTIKINTSEEWVSWFNTTRELGIGYKMIPIGLMFPRKLPCVIAYTMNYEINSNHRTCEYYIFDPYSLEDDDTNTK